MLHNVLDALTAVVGVEHVLVDDTLTAGFRRDWSGRFGGPCLAVVRPADTVEIAAAIRVLRAFGVPWIPQGGNTGLVGGGVPGPQADRLPVILSTTRLTRCDPVDGQAGTVVVGAGLSLGALQQHARTAGWFYGVDLAARDSATVGGTVATNAGGVRVCAFGMTRSQVVGIEAVLPDGEVISHLAGLRKDNTGYDLASLFTGSEGTLGVITAVTLRLWRTPGRSSLVMIGARDFDHAVDLVVDGVRAGTRVLAAEAVDATGMRLVRQLAHLPRPLADDYPLYVLLEVEDGGDGSGFTFGDPGSGESAGDVVMALDPSDHQRLWAYRERQSEAFGSLGVIHKLDVSVPLGRLAALANELRDEVSALPGVRDFGVFGHILDGNLHVEVAGPPPDDPSVTDTVLTLVAEHGGSISAEHGVGRAKVQHLALSRSASELSAMARIKNAIDPLGLSNPGVLLER